MLGDADVDCVVDYVVDSVGVVYSFGVSVIISDVVVIVDRFGDCVSDGYVDSFSVGDGDGDGDSDGDSICDDDGVVICDGHVVVEVDRIGDGDGDGDCDDDSHVNCDGDVDRIRDDDGVVVFVGYVVDEVDRIGDGDGDSDDDTHVNCDGDVDSIRDDDGHFFFDIHVVGLGLAIDAFVIITVDNGVVVAVRVPCAPGLLLRGWVCNGVPGRVILYWSRVSSDAVLPRDGMHGGGAGRAAAVLLECEHARGEWRRGVGRRDFDGGDV